MKPLRSVDAPLAAGMSARDAGLALTARLSSDCPHIDVVPVDPLVTGEVVAMLCAGCLLELPISWGCSECEWVEVQRLCDPRPTILVGAPCPRHAAVSTVA